MSNITEIIKKYALERGADLFGIANPNDFDTYFTEPHRAKDLLPDVKSIVVMGFHIPDSALEAQKNNITNYSYNMFGYTFLNREMDAAAYYVSKLIEKRGYQALPIPGRGANYWEKKKYYGPFSFRHAAVAAGLAKFGWSGLALSPEYGPRQRFIAILTDAPLDVSEQLKENPCQKCFECIKHCPSGAIKKEEWNCKLGENNHTYGVVDGDKCWWVAKGLTKKAWPDAPFNPNTEVERPKNLTADEKFKALWEKRDPRLRLSEHNEGNYGATLCGRCLIFCSAGIDAMNKRLKENTDKE